jgi:hypothetical protein
LVQDFYERGFARTLDVVSNPDRRLAELTLNAVRGLAIKALRTKTWFAVQTLEVAHTLACLLCVKIPEERKNLLDRIQRDSGWDIQALSIPEYKPGPMDTAVSSTEQRPLTDDADSWLEQFRIMYGKVQMLALDEASSSTEHRANKPYALGGEIYNGRCAVHRSTLAEFERSSNTVFTPLPGSWGGVYRVVVTCFHDWTLGEFKRFLNAFLWRLHQAYANESYRPSDGCCVSLWFVGDHRAMDRGALSYLLNWMRSPHANGRDFCCISTRHLRVEHSFFSYMLELHEHLRQLSPEQISQGALHLTDFQKNLNRIWNHTNSSLVFADETSLTISTECQSVAEVVESHEYLTRIKVSNIHSLQELYTLSCLPGRRTVWVFVPSRYVDEHGKISDVTALHAVLQHLIESAFNAGHVSLLPVRPQFPFAQAPHVKITNGAVRVFHPPGRSVYDSLALD